MGKYGITLLVDAYISDFLEDILTAWIQVKCLWSLFVSGKNNYCSIEIQFFKTSVYEWFSYFHFIFISYFWPWVFLCSKFNDIYDEDYFINTLKNDVRIVNKIPEYIMERFDHNMSNVFNFRVKAMAPVQYYRDAILPRLLEEQ